MARRLALAGALLLAPGCRSEVACDQCMPCTTPPCYKDDDADMGLQYTSNLPLGSARSPSPCWSQRNTAARRQNNPSKDGWANEKCVCDDDYVEYQTYSVGLDSLGREIMYTRPWYHRFCGPKQTEEFKIMGELTPVGAAAMYVCGCQQRYHVRSTVDVYDPYVSSADNPMPASPMMALLSNVRPQERSGDGRLEPGTEFFSVLLANGTREPVRREDIRWANSTGAPRVQIAASSNSTTHESQALPSSNRTTVAPRAINGTAAPTSLANGTGVASTISRATSSR